MALPPFTSPAANSIIYTIVKGNAFGQEVFNTFYHVGAVPASPGPTVAQVVDFLTAWRTYWRTKVLPLLTTDYTVQEYFAGIISGYVTPATGKPYKTFVSQTVIPGDAATDIGTAPAPSATLFDAQTVRYIPSVLTKRTRRSGRYGPVSASVYTADQQQWTLATRTLWEGACDPTQQTMTDVAWTLQFDPVAFSDWEAQHMAPPPSPYDWTGAFTPIIGVQARANVRSQVSRKQSNFGH